jgi:hypothetical protein
MGTSGVSLATVRRWPRRSRETGGWRRGPPRDERGSNVGFVPLRAGAPIGDRALRDVYACGEHAAYRPG